MSYGDFCRCTPSEFYKTWESWQKREDRRERLSWEQTRTECVCMLQPYSKEKLTARDVMTFSWDSEENEESVEKKDATSAPMSHEEEMARYRAMKAKWGLK